MKAALLGIATVALVGALGGCRDPLDPWTPIILPVIQIDAPASIAAGSPLSVDLTISIGCSRVERVEITRSASAAHITFWAPAVKGWDGTQCSMYKELKQTVTIDPPFASPFTVSGNGGSAPPPEQVTVEVQ